MGLLQTTFRIAKTILRKLQRNYFRITFWKANLTLHVVILASQSSLEYTPRGKLYPSIPIQWVHLCFSAVSNWKHYEWRLDSSGVLLLGVPVYCKSTFHLVITWMISDWLFPRWWRLGLADWVKSGRYTPSCLLPEILLSLSCRFTIHLNGL